MCVYMCMYIMYNKSMTTHDLFMKTNNKYKLYNVVKK